MCVLFFFFNCFFFSDAGIESRVSHILGNHSTAELHLSPSMYFYIENNNKKAPENFSQNQTSTFTGV
jgi:hypothetical protein